VLRSGPDFDEALSHCITKLRLWMQRVIPKWKAQAKNMPTSFTNSGRDVENHN
jgi:phosphotransferase system IIB component